MAKTKIKKETTPSVAEATATPPQKTVFLSLRAIRSIAWQSIFGLPRLRLAVTITKFPSCGGVASRSEVGVVFGLPRNINVARNDISEY